MKRYLVYRISLCICLAILGGIIYSYCNNTEENIEVVDYKTGLSSESILDENALVMPSGKPIGIYVKTDGVMVIAVEKFKAKTGRLVSPCEGILQSGDYIMAVDGNKVNDKNEFIEYIENSGGKSINLVIHRNKSELNGCITPVLNDEGKYMAGLWVKDDLSGIGTLTYVTADGFAALGHSINDNDTGNMFKISDGAIYNAILINIVKTDGKTPGRLEGVIDYGNSNMIGRVNSNTGFGISGVLYDSFVDAKASDELSQWVHIAKREEVHTGEAYIISAIKGEKKRYDIEITEITRDENGKPKNMVLRVTDNELIELTGGILQGCSGTPILQDGKLVGAVTHVFVADSTRGYGCFVEDMVKESR